MAFDQSTRNRLAKFVNESRTLLTDEFTRQLQNVYGMDPSNGEVTALENLFHLDDARRETARILRDTMAHYLAAIETPNPKTKQDVLDRIVREQAFTILNRLCALRMAEARDLLIESITKGYKSKGFQLYSRLAGSALGEVGDAYRTYLFSVFDEFSLDLGVLFDRFSPEGRLFPREAALLKLLDLINDQELEHLWAEDETIGWIYQYFNLQEERKQMRAESSAPRNSRELAVRNQFFTPRYVVEFLTDNTLGRIWYEMTKGETRLKETCDYLVRRPNEVFLVDGEEAPRTDENTDDLTQEELLCQPVNIPYRQLKDPREIKMLDPACGSMHFGLYAFDLFERIYEEAWVMEERLGAEALWRLADLEPLHDIYSNKAAFLRDVPRLIIEYNIHGIDIDPRSVQIAGLSLWLRAHNSWEILGVRQTERPQIRKSNIVCAEPMPGDRGMLEDFLETLDENRLEALLREMVFLPAGRSLRVTKAMADAFVDLVRTVWKEMELAGEAGSLLKIEETLREAITQARKFSAEKSPLFRVLEYDLEGETTQKGLDFWDYAERLVLAALHDYAERFANGVGYRKRLFAGDAVQGFAFIDLCRKRYDVVLINPPFGESSSLVQPYLEQNYPTWNKNLLCAFIEHGWEISFSEGAVGVIYDRTAIVKSTYEKFRRTVLVPDNRLTALADLGWGVLDANVEVTTSILHHRTYGKGFFIDAREAPSNEKAEFILNSAQTTPGYKVVIEKGKSFQKLPNAVIGYDFPAFLKKTFISGESLEEAGFKVNVGHQLKAEKHFRLWWELNHPSQAYFYTRMFNGAGYSPYYSAFFDCAIAPIELDNLAKDSATVLRNKGFQYLPGICYGKRGEFFCAQVLPSDHIFTVEGQAISITDKNDALELLGFLNTPLIRFSLNKYSGQHKTSGYVNLTPYKRFNDKTGTITKVTNVLRAYLQSSCLDETQSYFSRLKAGDSIKEYSIIMCNAITQTLSALDDCESFCHEQSITAYSVNDSEVQLLNQFRKSQPEPEPSIIDADVSSNCKWLAAHSIISIYMGCAFGRWDIRFATGECIQPKLPDHFAPLPACPPGMLQNNLGLPATLKDISNTYPLRISWSGILPDDPGHPEDIVNRLRDALQVIWDERGEAIEAEACEILGVSSLREYFQRTNLLFADHLKRYSKSRRYAPIYWPLSTPSGSYTLWLYYHRVTDQTLYTCITDFVDPKLKQVGEDLDRLRQKSGRARDEESELERLSDLERELKDFRTELLRVAAFWKPNLNDGVQITAAPLWKLFQHKPWQKKLKKTWEKLEAGEYDWAHLAHSIWPERVLEKCKTDKSLAIAHSLEHLYQEQVSSSAKTKKRKKQNELQGKLLNEN